ncbi:MAG: hypothetical protein ABH829_03980 [archaeon]
MVISRTSIVVTASLLFILHFFNPSVQQVIMIGIVFVPLPLYYFGIIGDPFPSKTSVISTAGVILLDHFSVSPWKTFLVCVVVSSILDLYFKGRKRPAFENVVDLSESQKKTL